MTNHGTAVAAIRRNGATIVVLGALAALLLLAAIVAAGEGAARGGVVNQSVREAGGAPGGVLGDRAHGTAANRQIRGGAPGGVLGDRHGLARKSLTGLQ